MGTFKNRLIFNGILARKGVRNVNELSTSLLSTVVGRGQGDPLSAMSNGAFLRYVPTNGSVRQYSTNGGTTSNIVEASV
jgi:hypothetical protein